jgi:hypothetical protein
MGKPVAGLNFALKFSRSTCVFATMITEVPHGAPLLEFLDDLLVRFVPREKNNIRVLMPTVLKNC